MSNYVFLIDANKTPMNPIHPAQARKLMELEHRGQQIKDARIGIKLEYVEKPIHRKDGYSYG